MNEQFLKKFFQFVGKTSSTLVRYELAKVSLLLENYWFFAKIDKNSIFGHTSSFWDFSKKKTSLVFYEKFKTDLGFEIRQPQRKYQRRPTLQSLANPAVQHLKFWTKDTFVRAYLTWNPLEFYRERAPGVRNHEEVPCGVEFLDL